LCLIQIDVTDNTCAIEAKGLAMRVYLLDQIFPWWGRMTGFGLLRPNLARYGCDAHTIRPRPQFVARLAGKIYSTCDGVKYANQRLAAAELEFLLRLKTSQSVGHVLFLEEHLQLLKKHRAPGQWVGTINQPLPFWTPEKLDLLRKAPSAIVLCDQHREDFSPYIPTEKIQVAHHGVETDFFKPLEGENSGPQHLICVGHWLRNIKMFGRLMPRILDHFPNVIFDCVVPAFVRKGPAYELLLNHPAVRWHQGLSDEQLRALYQNAAAMLMPMDDSGANNAILEALACGVPVITTDVGGIRSYGGGTVFPLVANNDDDACLALVDRYLSDESYRRETGEACRTYAVSQLDWKVVAAEFANAYRVLGLA
jgi:glycosyltransferase involved in cell wall biosynthesis